MGILADRIEQFILEKLLEDQEQAIVLRRNELADELECAPSQISYVLSTRFSTDRGFTVESRRGLGGFISITRIPVSENVASQQVKKEAVQDKKPLTLGAVDNALFDLIKHKLLTKREAAFLHEAFAILMEESNQEQRTKQVRRLYGAVLKLTREA